MYGYNYYQPENYIKKQNEKDGIKKIGIAAGLCVIAYVLIQNILSLVIAFVPSLYRLYIYDATFQSVVTIFISVLSIVVPFGIAGAYFEKKTGTEVFKFNKPVSTPLMLTAVPLGFFVCLVGNYVTSWFVTIMDMAGITLTSPEYDAPADFAGRIVYVIAIAVVPAFAEEFAIRGAVLQPLRRYGDKFAILASSIVFAVLHGNLIQAPFALIAGIGIGYAVCITNSIWTGVLIHFCNNFYSVMMDFLISDVTNEEKLNLIYYAVMIVLYAVSIAGSVAFVIIKKKRRLVPSFTALTERAKLKAFVFTVPMIIGLIIMLGITLQYVEFK